MGGYLLFEPPYSTKNFGIGLGVKNITKQHGGRVAIESTEENGTKISLFLPMPI